MELFISKVVIFGTACSSAKYEESLDMTLFATYEQMKKMSYVVSNK